MWINFYKAIEEVLTNHEPLLYQLRVLRDLLKQALTNDDFRLSCVEQVLLSINGMLHDRHWHAPPLFYHEQLKFSIRIIFWPAFYENNPHQHKTWSITGVLHNDLKIRTYQLLDQEKSLRKEREFTATVGEVGYLLPGCIHNISNATHQLSGSIHIFNNIDVLHPEENAIWYPVPRKYNLSMGLLERAFMVCLRMVADIKQPRSLDIIKQIYTIAPVDIKFIAVQAMYGFDREYAHQCFENLAIDLESGLTVGTKNCTALPNTYEF